MQLHVYISKPQRIVKRSRLRNLVIPAMLLAATASFGRVYTLIPGRSGSTSGPIDEVLNPKTIWNEPVVINGVKMRLKIGLINKRLDLLLENIKNFFPGAKFAANSNTLLIRQKQKDGSEKRILLMYFGGGMPMVQFSIKLPAKLPRNFVWPAKLPITFDGKPKKYIALPNQKVVYGIFRTSAYRENAISEMSSKLEANGWKPLSNALKTGKVTGGEMFYRKKPPGIMIINCSQDGVATSFYHPVSKK
jgi:hypothetical protein